MLTATETGYYKPLYQDDGSNDETVVMSNVSDDEEDGIERAKHRTQQAAPLVIWTRAQAWGKIVQANNLIDITNEAWTRGL